MAGADPEAIPPEPIVSVVVPCRSHAGELARCLPTLISQNPAGNAQFIVVDSAADPEVAAVAAKYPSVTLVRSTEGLLPGEARNLGAAAAQGRYLAFLDADCIAAPGWLAHALAALARGAVIVGGPVLHGNGIHPIAVVDNLMQFSEVPPGRPEGIVALIPSCNMAIARADFFALGGFPRPAGGSACGEDVLFCTRAAQRWPSPIRFDRGMRIRHFGRSRLRELLRHQYRFGWVRGHEGLVLAARYRRLGRLAAVMPLVAGKRLCNLAARAVAWQPANLLYMLLFAPILALGLGAWAYGFWQGCRADELATGDRIHHPGTAYAESELEQR
jgi:GT2 family glycosyltransferase